MTYKLKIPFTLLGLNQYISAERGHWSNAAKIKRESEVQIIMLCKSQLRGVSIKRPVFIHYLWIEKNRQRDKDNVSSYGRKVIQDALVKAGILQNDGWDYIDGFSDSFTVDKKKPGIEIVIKEIEERKYSE